LTVNEILKSPILKTNNSLNNLKVDLLANDSDCVSDYFYHESKWLNKEKRILVKEHLHFETGDGRRGAWIYSIEFDGIPLAIQSQSGREGDDFIMTFITNYNVYEQMIKYLFLDNDIEVEYRLKKDTKEYKLNETIPLKILYGINVFNELYPNKNLKLNYRKDEILYINDKEIIKSIGRLSIDGLEYIYPFHLHKDNEDIKEIQVKIKEITSSKYSTYGLEVIDYKYAYNLNTTNRELHHIKSTNTSKLKWEDNDENRIDFYLDLMDESKLKRN